MQGQPPHLALATNLLRPDYLRIVCSPLDRLPEPSAELERQDIAIATCLRRNTKDAALPKRIREWAADG